MKLEPIYQVLLLGSGTKVHGDALESLIAQRARDISEGLADAMRVCRAGEFDQLTRYAPMVSVYLGGDPSVDTDQVARLQDDAVPIIPVVSALDSFKAETPELLHPVNGTAIDWAAPDFTAIVNVVFENLSLLRRERRLFISYLREESQPAAHQLRVAFDDAGYDTFLDLSSVPKGDDFQAVLMHRLLDSDVMILLDTPNFLKSRWTKEEVAQASAMSVGILRVAWPEVTGERFAELAMQLLLKDGDVAADALTPDAVTRIVTAAEALRARNLAARHDNLIGEFCEAAEDAGLQYAVQPQRFVIGWKADGQRVAAIPAVGVPDAQRFHDASRRFPVAGEVADEAVLLYDHRGMHGAWTEFLQWLDQYLPVKGLRVTDTAAFLKGTE
mgnify:CR=1 FL=1|jgi:hypothetical protein